MKTKLLFLFILMGLQSQVQAARIYIELKDCSLFDAVQMLYRAADLPAPTIDERAKNYNIGTYTERAIDPTAAARVLANRFNFKVVKQNNVTLVVPRN